MSDRKDTRDRLTFSLPPGVRPRLEAEAHRRGLKPNQLITLLVSEWFGDHAPGAGWLRPAPPGPAGHQGAPGGAPRLPVAPASAPPEVTAVPGGATGHQAAPDGAQRLQAEPPVTEPPAPGSLFPEREKREERVPLSPPTPSPPADPVDVEPLVARYWAVVDHVVRLEERCKLQGPPMAARRALAELYAAPGAPDFEREFLPALRAACAAWREKAAEDKAKGARDPWQYVPHLARWLRERHWEAAPAPEVETDLDRTRRQKAERERREQLEREEAIREHRARHRGRAGTGLAPVGDVIGGGHA